MKKPTFIGFIVCFLVLTSFQRREKQDLVQIGLKNRIEQYKAEQMEACRMQILLEAEHYVDSIISEQFKAFEIDSTKAPPKPERPVRPYDSLTLDSMILIPLLDPSIEQDTIRMDSSGMRQ